MKCVCTKDRKDYRTFIAYMPVCTILYETVGCRYQGIIEDSVIVQDGEAIKKFVKCHRPNEVNIKMQEEPPYVCLQQKEDGSKVLEKRNRFGEVERQRVCRMYTGTVQHCRYLGSADDKACEVLSMGIRDSCRFYAKCHRPHETIDEAIAEAQNER